MAAFDYSEFVVLANELITESGRPVTLYQLSAANADNAKPWRGAGVATQINPVATYGAFVVPNTSIPTESRGLAFDWIDDDLLKRARELCLVPANGLDLTDYKELTDGGQLFKIIWGQAFKPGPTIVFYVFGLAK